MSESEEIFPKRNNDTIILSMAQLELLKVQIIDETKEAIKAEAFAELGKITFSYGKGLFVRSMQCIGIIGLASAYFLHSKGFFTDMKF